MISFFCEYFLIRLSGMVLILLMKNTCCGMASYDAILSFKLSPYGCKETQNRRHHISIYWNWKRRQVNEPLFWLEIINAKRPPEQCLNKKIRNNNLGRYKIKISITIKRIYNNTSERRKIWLPIFDSCLFE